VKGFDSKMVWIILNVCGLYSNIRDSAIGNKFRMERFY
jgi:hypothetical protein